MKTLKIAKELNEILVFQGRWAECHPINHKLVR